MFDAAFRDLYPGLHPELHESAGGYVLCSCSNVVALLDEYDVAKAAESSSNLSDTEGKVLVKADVLEWEVTGAGVPSGAQQEMNRIRMEVANYFAFCSCMGGMLPGAGGSGGYGTSSLIRS